MESYGEMLKKRRQALGLSLDKVSKDTAILKEDLLALEAEDEASFSGEPYLVGFLKVFAEYIGLDADNLVALYKAKKLQEAPVPLELLARKRPRSFWILLTSGIFLCLLLLGFGLFYFLFWQNMSNKEEELSVTKETKTKMYELTDKPLIRRLYKGDQVTVPTANGQVILTVVDTKDVLSLDTPVGLQQIELSEEIELDIDGDKLSDLIVYVSDVSKGEKERGAETRLLVNQGGSVVATVDENSVMQAMDLQTNKYTVVFDDNRAYPFTVSAVFRAPCVMRYQTDRKDKVEEYFASGDLLTMTASNAIRLWVSNIAAVKLQIIAGTTTYDLEVGKSGQVKVEDIKWVRDSSGKYSMVVLNVD